MLIVAPIASASNQYGNDSDNRCQLDYKVTKFRLPDAAIPFRLQSQGGDLLLEIYAPTASEQDQGLLFRVDLGCDYLANGLLECVAKNSTDSARLLSCVVNS